MSTAAETWLHEICEYQTGVIQGLVIRGRPGEKAQLLGIWPNGAAPVQALLEVAADTMDGQFPIQQAIAGEDGRSRIYPLPVRLARHALGAVVIQVRNATPKDDDTYFNLLRKKLSLLEQSLSQSAMGGIGPAEVLSLQAALLAHQRFALGATALANELTGLLHSDRVSIGLYEDGSTRVAAVSHSSTERHGGDDVLAIAAAMDECVDQQAAILYPPPSRGQPRITLAHEALAKRMGGATLLTLPLVDRMEVVGAMTIENRHGIGFNEEEVTKLEHMAGMIGSLLVLKRNSDQPLRRRLAFALRGVWRKLTGPGHVTLKTVSAGSLLTIALLTLVPVDYRVTAPVRLEGKVQRILAAPSDGFIQAVHARPGDTVKAGQVLIDLARQDLLLELQRGESELAQHENAYGAAMSSGDRAQLAVSLARMQEAQARVELVRVNLARSRVEAPFDGVVISGDLSQSLGTPVERGHALLTVAPQEGRRLIIEVDERDIGRISLGQQGEFALKALPGKTLALTVARITPVASNRDGRNFFEVEASMSEAMAELRPGLEGVAKIDSGRQSLAWIGTHRALEWLRLNLWRWLG